MPPAGLGGTLRHMPMIDVYAAAGTFDPRRWGIAGHANTQADIAASARAALAAG